MKSISKGIRLSAAALLCLFALNLNQPTLAAKSVTIKVWHFFGGSRLPMMNAIFADFQKKNPEIKLQITALNEFDRHNKLLAAVAAGQAPDLAMLGRQDIPSYVLRRVLTPLDAYMKRGNISKNDFYNSEFSPCVYQGKTWLIPCPVGGAQNMLFYNKDFFKEAGLNPAKPPKTWAELELYSKKLTVMGANNVLKRVGFLPSNWQGLQWIMPYFYSNNSKWLDPTGKKVLLNTPKSYETMRWLAQYQKRVYGTAKVPAVDFTKGSLAMEYNGSWHMYELKSTGFKYNYGIAPIPHNDGGESHGIIVGGWGYIIPGNTKHANESWKLLEYLTIGDGARKFYKDQLRPAPVRAINKDRYFNEHLADWDKITDIMENDIALPMTPAGPDLDKIIGQMQVDAFSGKRSPEAAVQWASTEAQKILDLAWRRVESRR